MNAEALQEGAVRAGEEVYCTSCQVEVRVGLRIVPDGLGVHFVQNLVHVGHWKAHVIHWKDHADH